MPRHRLAIAVALVSLSACVSVPEHPPRPLQEDALHLVEVGTRGESGNLLLVQGYVDTGDYASVWNFSAKIENYLEQARLRGWLGSKTVVVLPARWAEFLVFADEPPQVFQLARVDDAVRYSMQARWLDAIVKGAGAPVEDRLGYALWSSKGPQLADLYQKLFARIARSYRITLVASTVILPAPSLHEGRIVVDPAGPLRRCTFVFASTGEVLETATCQTDLSATDQRLLSPGSPSAPVVYPTPAGRMAILLGDELFDRRQDAALAEAKIDLLVAPQGLLEPDVWSAPWPQARHFSSSSPSPSPSALHAPISLGEAVQHLGLGARLRATQAQAGAVVYLRGRLWGQGTDGQTLASKNGLLQTGPHTDAPVLLNLWLGPEPDPAPPAPSPKVHADEDEDAMLPGLTWPGKTPPKKRQKKKRRRRRGR